ncbi:MAG: glycine--tRNA ligase subunit beta, partial [Gammaproteobacteria bacterium]
KVIIRHAPTWASLCVKKIMANDLLIEIGCEELPPKRLQSLATAFAENIRKEIETCGLTQGNIQSFATPRRLAVIIEQIADRQIDEELTKYGPALKDAFDDQGQPTKACLGFAKKWGVPVDELIKPKETDKNQKMIYRTSKKGKKTQELLPDIINNALKKLAIAKPMRWGAGPIEFIRPVHWVIVIFGVEVVPCDILGLKASNNSYGHRFHAPEAIVIEQPKEYQKKLKQAYVIVDFEQRKKIIQQQVEDLAKAKNAQVILDPDLLNEVTGLVEWPIALLANFEKEFLQVPKEALVAAMRDHQKCFSLVDQDQQLLPHFITVANIKSEKPQIVVAGNERVMRARLSDAKFFFDNDKKTPLADRLEKTKHVIFQRKLGSLYDKAARLAKSMPTIATMLDIDQKSAQRAGRLSKCDLVTDMVQEFTELQGTMGYYYALHDGEAKEVALALKEQYLPRFAQDSLPQTTLGCALALAERLDHLVGMLIIYPVPKGMKDPYKLRRTGLAIARIIIEKQFDLDLDQLLACSIENYQHTLSKENKKKEDVAQTASQLILNRLSAYYTETQGIPQDQFNAARKWTQSQSKLFDLHHRIIAIHEFSSSAQAEALAIASKRVHNILKNVDEKLLQVPWDQQLMQIEAERALVERLTPAQAQIDQLCKQKHYRQALNELAELRDPVDRFFDDVMVMVEDIELRNNRLRILYQLNELLRRIVPISELQFK